VDGEKQVMPKGGLDLSRSLVFANVLVVLGKPLFCSSRVMYFRWCSSALLYGLLYSVCLYNSVWETNGSKNQTIIPRRSKRVVVPFT